MTTEERTRPDRLDPAELAARTRIRLGTPTVTAGRRSELTFGLTFGPADAAPCRFVYELVVVVRRLDGELAKMIARRNGVLEAGDSGVRAEADELPAGIYRLDAAVTLSKPSNGFRGHTAFVEGAMFTVLPG
jgi:hypothetical protein